MERPDNLIEALSEIRASGRCNMLALEEVSALLESYGYGDSARYIQQHQESYLDIMQELADYVRNNPELTLAEQLARQTGWEIIEDGSRD